MTNEIEEKVKTIFGQSAEPPSKPPEYSSAPYYPNEPSSLGNALWYVLIAVAILSVGIIILFKPFSVGVSGVCPEVRCENSSLTCPSIPVCNPLISINSTPNLSISCPTMICNPSYSLACYGNLSSSNVTYMNTTYCPYNLTTTNLNLVIFKFINGTQEFNSSMAFMGNGTYRYNYTITENTTTNYTYEIRIGG